MKNYENMPKFFKIELNVEANEDDTLWSSIQLHSLFPKMKLTYNGGNMFGLIPVESKTNPDILIDIMNAMMIDEEMCLRAKYVGIVESNI